MPTEMIAPPTAADWWDMAEPALSASREPEAWFTRIAERVEVRDDELHRHVSNTLRTPRPVDAANGQVVVAVQTPRKGTLVDLELRTGDGAKAHVLTHEEHKVLSKMMVAFRFRSVMRLALDVTPKRKTLEERGPAVIQRLLDLVDGDPESRSEPAAIRARVCCTIR